MGKKFIYKIYVLLLGVFIYSLFNVKIVVRAFSATLNYEQENEIIEETQRIFGDVIVDNIEFLYGFNESPDYVYVNFENSGYVIYFYNTLEIMEYSYEKNINYDNANSKKYYAGPSNYYEKRNDKFVDIATGDYLNLTNSEAKDYANQIYKFLSVDTDERQKFLIESNITNEKTCFTSNLNDNKQAPKIDTDNPIIPNAPGSANTKYIKDYQYFMVNPKYGNNKHGTCGSVASQLLLGFNNYYNDRRIVDVQYLNGGWKAANSDDIFDSSNYLSPSDNINVCSNPMSLTSDIAGTNDDFYKYIIGTIEPKAFNCICTTTDIKIFGKIATVEVTINYPDGTSKSKSTTREAKDGEKDSTITEHSHSGSSTSDVVHGLKTILSSKLSKNDFEVSYDEEWWSLGWSPISSEKIKDEIDLDNPLIIGMNSNLGGKNHWVVGYGYQDFTYSDGSGTYSGYIVHFGWDGEYNIWVNESWCDSYITLRLKHNHNYDVVTSNIIENSFIEVRCSECGHRKLENLYTVSDNAIVSVNYPLLSDVTIPRRINDNVITGISSNVFKNEKNLRNIVIPNTVTHIDSSAFEGCSNLQSVTLPNNLITIGSSAFKGCTSLQSVTLPNNLITIGSSAFEGCTSLNIINLPLSVKQIDAEAFKNCSSLALVNINRKTNDITNLGENAFDGCNNDLKIIVPTNREAEYKNKEYWSSYRNKIIPSEKHSNLEIDCESNLTNNLYLYKALNRLYELNVKCSKSYKINTNSSNIVNIIIYDSNMNVVSSDSNTITQFLGCGTYYISFEFDDTNASGTFGFEISLTWKSTDILVTNGVNNIKNSMHLNSEGVYHCKYLYISNSKDGLYKFSLKALNNTSYPEGAIKIYKDQNRKEILDRYLTAQINKQAISERNENEIYVYISYNERFYIDITLLNRSYTSITLSIEEPETCEFDYQDRLTSISFDSLFDNKSCSAYFEEVTISHPSKIELDIMTSGTINKNIPIYIFEKHRDPGYEPGINHYYIILKYTDDIISTNRSPVFTIVLEAGTYYIGYANNTDNIEINFALRRKVNTNLNIDGTLVTDPARDQGFPLGSEVIFNEGILSGNTITEGFTRNLYLMVEDRLREPMSRLEYYWYSTNENIAKVTKYGTVLALNVDVDTSVTIYAINIKDPSIIYRKDLTILKETKTKQITIKSNMSYSYSKKNGMYTLELDFTNSPYPYIGYYVWDIECFDGININMEHHGLIESTGPGEAILTANYILNRRIFLEINLTITE